ncbi:putative ABC transport system substrate-binding protein [Jezberella montanilacus]|uniref:Putative ABC transport system substrate-binding protein n=1 Tax=Jezberella montanilacus TaxID=323426 RepID=A0A2T0XK13_9BURK|nr:ABC transporter substrate-binding protein [Jezberella montanilacus]PRY99273.1 putative ABC transport system substrate-binding protein [Jezberella montanilacus]
MSELSLSRAQFIWHLVLLSLLVCLGGYSSAARAQLKQVTIVAARDSESTTSLIAGLKDALKTMGLIEGKHVKFKFDNAVTVGGDLDLLAQTAIAGKPDVIVALTAPVVSALLMHARAQESKVPIIYGDVYDPEINKLATEQSAGPIQMSGVISSISLNRQVELIRTLAPTAKRIGVLYRSGSPTSSAVVKQLTEALSKFGLVLIEYPVTRVQDVGSAARSMLSKIDVFFSIDDATVSQAYPVLVKVSIEAKLPLIASQAGGVNQGALAGLEFNQKEVGQQLGRLLSKVLKGIPVSAIPQETITKPSLWLNQITARKLGWTFAETILKSAAQVVDK